MESSEWSKNEKCEIDKLFVHVYLTKKIRGINQSLETLNKIKYYKIDALC